MMTKQFKLKNLVVALTHAGLVTFLSNTALANPQDGHVVAGTVNIQQENATKLGITQTSDKAIVDWHSFSIAPNEHTQFYMPSASSVILNRVVGQDPSAILGRMSANGQVFLVNPNGIYFGKNAQIDVAGLVATTHNIKNADFLAGHYNFNLPGKSGAAVINEGMIRIADTGIAAFVAPSVVNDGVIAAKLGKVELAAANGFTLDFYGDNLLAFMVDDKLAQTAFDREGKPLTSFVENSGRIAAEGGYVLLTAKGAENTVHSVINQSGVIEATTVGTHKGEIILQANQGSLAVSGKLDASAPNGGDGGFIETSGAHVKVADSAQVTTKAANGKSGIWLIDPVDFTIAASGGDMTGSAVSTALSSNNFQIQSSSGTHGGTSGDINVNDVVSWSANKLTLTAQNNININANMNATGSGKLALEYGQGAAAAGNTSNVITHNGAAVNLPASTTNFTTKQGFDGVVKNYTVITNLGVAGDTSVTTLQGMKNNLSGNYVLGKDIDASATAAWNSGAGFKPIGNYDTLGDFTTGFTGVFNGLGHTVSGLTISRPTTDDVGLFGYTNGATISNIGLVGGSVVGGNGVGGLVGYNTSTVSNSYAMNSVSGRYFAGGLIGVGGNDGTVSNSYATGSVTSSSDDIGGLVGVNSGSISNSYATGIANL